MEKCWNSLKGGEPEMRFFIESEMGWAAVPFIVLIGVAYMWLADRLLTRKASATHVDVPTIAKAA
jgi:hypothetical protein